MDQQSERVMESMQAEHQKENKRKVDRLRDLYDSVKCTTLHIKEVPEREGQGEEKGRKLT